MNFEETTKQYLIDLKNQNVLIDAYIFGVNEEFECSTCMGRFLEDGTVKEKKMIVHKEGDTLKWNLLETVTY